ncbi:MAG: hypothetical protein Q7S73_02810 [bacterium]|nr:hypothetical protein [bacterium]
MRFLISKLNTSTKTFLRQCGYIEIANPHKNNEISYARSLDPGRFYPRFHIYPVRDREGSQRASVSNGVYLSFDLHLDAKKPSYEGTSAHSGEYDGQIIEEESERIKKIAERFKPENHSPTSLGFVEKKSLWQKIKDYFV